MKFQNTADKELPQRAKSRLHTKDKESEWHQVSEQQHWKPEGNGTVPSKS